MLPISEYFGELTFGLGQMREKLPRDAYQNLFKTLEHGKKLPRDSADAIAAVIKEWAVSKGATHFCHWFQPMTGLTAEKHDAFISIQHSHHSELKVVERLSGRPADSGRTGCFELSRAAECARPSRRAVTRRGTLPLRSSSSKARWATRSVSRLSFSAITVKRSTTRPRCSVRYSLCPPRLASF